MESLDAVEAETVLSGRAGWMGEDLQAALAEHPLDCIDVEYPHFVYAVEGPDDLEAPAERHPVFYGCFDWHSAVHSHWCLVRLLRLFDDHPDAGAIDAALSGRFDRDAMAAEAAHLEANPSFERPYGWAWCLRLAAELSLWDDPRATAWREALAPLEEQVVASVEAELLPMERPFRVGTHQNSAFALQCVIDYARVVGHDGLEAAAVDAARRWYEGDRDAPVRYEPLSWDFVSPALAEADLMRRVLEADRFAAWLDGFLPDVTGPPHDALLEPASTEADDGLALHFVGLNLTRAWCLADLDASLDGDPYDGSLRRSAARHAERGLADAFTDDYAGAHWLSSFVLYLLTRHEGGIAPG